MDRAFSSALLFASLAFIIKLILFAFDMQYSVLDNYLVFAYLLFILLAIFFSVRKLRKQETSSIFVQDFRAGMKTTALFSVMLAFFIFSYYKFIDREYLQKRIDERVELAESADFTEMQKNNPALKDMTKEDMVQKEREMVETIFSPFNHATFTLLGMMIAGAAYSLLIVLLFRKTSVFSRF